MSDCEADCDEFLLDQGSFGADERKSNCLLGVIDCEEGVNNQPELGNGGGLCRGPGERCGGTPPGSSPLRIVGFGNVISFQQFGKR